MFDANDLKTMMTDTTCDGVSLGRIAIAKPWLFAVWTDGFQPPATIHKDVILEMIRLLDHHFAPTLSIKLFKKYAIYFAANFKFGHAIYKTLSRATNLAEAEDLIHRVFTPHPEVLQRPDMNMFTR